MISQFIYFLKRIGIEQNYNHLVKMEVTNSKQSSYRFVIAFCYILTALVNSLPVQTFSSINVIVEDKFSISAFEVTLNALLFTIAHPIFAFPCNWILNKYSMRLGFIIGGLLVSAGVWMRLLIGEGNSIYCLIGSGLAAIGNIFVFNTPSKIALNWFRADRAPIIIFLGVVANMISITVGAAVPGLIIKNQSTQQDVRSFLRMEAIIVTVPYILLNIFFREKPQIPPSKAARAVRGQKKQNYKILLKKLFSNKEYLKHLIAMSLNYGTLTAFIMVLDQGLKGLGYVKSGEVTSYTVLSAMAFGTLFVPFFSFILRKSKAYRAISSLSAFGGFFMILILQFCFYTFVSDPWSIALVAGFAGVFLIPFPSLLVSYSSEVVFPIDQSSSAGYLFAASQTFGFIIGIISINLLDSSSLRSKIIFSVYAGLLLLSFVIVFFTKQDLKKYKFQQLSQINLEKQNLTDSLIIKQSKEFKNENTHQQK